VDPSSQDTAGVRFPPPLIYAGGFVVGYAVHQFVPAHLRAELSAPQRVAAWCLVAAAVLLAGSALFLFRRAGTTPNPTKRTTALVLHGPYRFTRNPIYLGFAALYLGLALLVNSLWPLLLLPAVIALVQTHVIAREEAYLEARFGEEYRTYKARVRRWI